MYISLLITNIAGLLITGTIVATLPKLTSLVGLKKHMNENTYTLIKAGLIIFGLAMYFILPITNFLRNVLY